MRRTGKNSRGRALAAALLMVLVSGAAAQSWPARSIRWIVPFPPGGASDLTARLLSQKLSERFKQPVLVDNRPGAASTIGMEAAVKSAPDGYTMLFVIPNLVTASVLYKINFDPLKELTPVAQLTNVFFVMVVNNSVPAKTVGDVIALARSKPGLLTCAYGGGMSQFLCEMLKLQGKGEITTVPYKGLAPAWNDVLAGRVSMLFDITSTVLPYVKSNRGRAIATSSSKREPGPFGGLPTMSETLPGLEVNAWQGVVVPAGTPREVILRLNREIAIVMKQPDVLQRLAEIGLDPATGTPEAFGEIIQQDHAKYSKLIREAGIRAE